MITKIWEKCDGLKHIKRLSLTSFRAQANEELALRIIVDNLEEENVLQRLLENFSTDNSTSLLKRKFTTDNKYGSRFGHHYEPVIWYGSENKLLALTEKAFYNFAYLADNENITTINGQEILVFTAKIDTELGIRLNEKPFDQYENLISSPTSYENSRLLGKNMRNASIKAFTYISARSCSEPRGINTGVFSLDAFPSRSENHTSYEFWKCFANQSDIEFHNQNPMSNERIMFNINDFLRNGMLPGLIS